MHGKALPYLLLMPATLFLCVFFLYPFALVAFEAFTRDGGFTLDNFRTMTGNWRFPVAFWNTILLATIVVPIQLVMALLMATVVSRLEAGRGAALYIFAIPLGISDLAAGLIWLAIFDQSGFLNTLLSNLGLVDRPVMFLGYQSKLTIFVAVVLAEIWRATAIMMVILVAGMGLIPREYHEAAEVFGASPWKRFVKITLPLLRPSLQTAIILRVILAFEVFAVVAALGGTNLPVLMGETYNWQFSLQDRNVAAAFALLILAISVGLTLFFMRVLRVPKEARI
ncbi:sugar ABC transporter permease [Mesorhizobium sp. M9A.F.Ca.ET.002.03.1.2]|uniref:carbohydrate ABC transporter permease n=1 Tax=Mesorhizobium sp. M9A.F.Ca.ET.002.03.1.2 TaxID=2493668 RepID=UPI000F74C31F|nr:sugar ABC transporter permease [Mesorhizobium sp. M9A.F.Ca.ET.002.03.1.2]AZN98432.1 sugar ABC transporter permease [Mesorhizobium sp. M9A.F.Ca.ET.002.03.1.2]